MHCWVRCLVARPLRLLASTRTGQPCPLWKQVHQCWGFTRLLCLHAQLQGRTQSPERLGGGWGLFLPWQVRARASRTAPLRSQGEALEAQSWRARRASSVDALSALHKMGGQMLSQFFLFGKLKRGLRGRGVAWACTTRGYPCTGPGGRGNRKCPEAWAPSTVLVTDEDAPLSPP